MLIYTEYWQPVKLDLALVSRVLLGLSSVDMVGPQCVWPQTAAPSEVELILRDLRTLHHKSHFKHRLSGMAQGCKQTLSSGWTLQKLRDYLLRAKGEGQTYLWARLILCFLGALCFQLKMFSGYLAVSLIQLLPATSLWNDFGLSQKLSLFFFSFVTNRSFFVWDVWGFGVSFLRNLLLGSVCPKASFRWILAHVKTLVSKLARNKVLNTVIFLNFGDYFKFKFD